MWVGDCSGGSGVTVNVRRALPCRSFRSTTSVTVLFSPGLRRQSLRQRKRIADRLAIHLDNHIADLQVGLRCGRILLNRDNRARLSSSAPARASAWAVASRRTLPAARAGASTGLPAFVALAALDFDRQRPERLLGENRRQIGAAGHFLPAGLNDSIEVLQRRRCEAIAGSGGRRLPERSRSPACAAGRCRPSGSFESGFCLGPHLVPFVLAVGLRTRSEHVVAAVEHGRGADVAPAQEFVGLALFANLNDLGAGLECPRPRPRRRDWCCR